MGRKREGTAWQDKADGRWIVQWPLADGSRSKPVKLGPEVTTRPRAKEIAKAYMERAAREGTTREVIGAISPPPAPLPWPEGPGVYLVSAADRMKIGRAGKSIAARLRSLQTASSHPLALRAVLPGGAAEERELHARFARLHLHREWFSFRDELAAFVCEIRRRDA